MYTTWLPESGLRADHARGEHRRFGMSVAKIEQRGQAVGFEGAAFQFRVAHFQPVQLGLEGFIVFAARGASQCSRPSHVSTP